MHDDTESRYSALMTPSIGGGPEPSTAQDNFEYTLDESDMRTSGVSTPISVLDDDMKYLLRMDSCPLTESFTPVYARNHLKYMKPNFPLMSDNLVRRAQVSSLL